MFQPTKVIDIELSHPLTTVEGLDGYGTLKSLVRLHGTPLGYIQTPVINGRCSSTDLSQVILAELSQPIMRRHLCNLLTAPLPPEGWSVADLVNALPPVYDGPLPLVTVAVCTRDRTDNLTLCLDALNQLDYPNLDILIVDNAPSDDAIERLVHTPYPNIRYVCEPRPGLDWARNRAIIEAQGEIIAYTDDDVIVDPCWVKALVQPFIEDSAVMAVTGLVTPYELETEAQTLFEIYGGFGRGFKRGWYQVNPLGGDEWEYRGTGRFGTGANMAYRRRLFDLIGPFDPALDVGTVTNGGGDLEMFFRVLKEGHILVYEPSAIVRHRHRREYEQLYAQIANNGSLYSFFVRSALAYPDERWAFFRLGMWWFWWWLIRRLLLSFLRPSRLPRGLIWGELFGIFKGLFRYQKAQQIAIEIAETYGVDDQIEQVEKSDVALKGNRDQYATAVRMVDISQSLKALTDINEYANVRVFVTYSSKLLGQFNLSHFYRSIGVTELREAIVDALMEKLIEPGSQRSQDAIWADLLSALKAHYTPTEEQHNTVQVNSRLPAYISVSIIVATYDRPSDLYSCLEHLVAQKCEREVEIIVIDNHPNSGLTPPIVVQFPEVMLVNEPRPGVSYARNAGINASSGDIIVTTDDDVITPSDWLEKLLTPFARNDIIAVTGNILPAELETVAQLSFETYGGLGRGFEPLEVDGKWFETFTFDAVPTWELGGTANAAFRATIFNHPQIGLMDETLGPGLPSGVGEDTYLFYKILKAGHTIMYEPDAYLWHKHRRTLRALRRQIYNYSKGHVAYHLTTLFQDHDLRALLRLGIWLPLGHLWRIIQRVRGKSGYTLLFLMIEIAGNLVGPWALWRSHWRVKRLGRSEPYVPGARRSSAGQGLPLIENQPTSPEMERHITTGIS